MATDFQGIGVALVTPFTSSDVIDSDVIDEEAISRLLTHLTDVDYFVVCGTTGEAATLTATEKLALLKTVKSLNSDNKPIVYGIGGNNTQAVTKDVQNLDIAVDAVLSVSPAYNKPSQNGIIAHFRQIADNSKYPIIMYNVPSRTGSNMLAETTLRLAEHKNIIGIKEASGDLGQCKEIIENKPEDFRLISGDDMLTPDLLAMGASGVISVMANAFPEHFIHLYKKGDSDRFLQLSAINPLMYEEGNPVGIKEVLRLMGICENHVRLPLLPASNTLSKSLKELYGTLK